MPLHHNDIWGQICFFMSHEEMHGESHFCFPIGPSICPLTSQSLSPLYFWGKISPNFNLKNMIFDLYEGSPMIKMAQICQISKKFIWKLLDEHNLDYVGFFEVLLFPMCSHKVLNGCHEPKHRYYGFMICLGCWIVICQIEKWVHGCIYLFFLKPTKCRN